MSVKADEFKKSQLSDAESRQLIREAIDMHIHGPDDIPRRFNPNATQISEEVGKIAGLIFKSHLRHDMVELAEKLTVAFNHKLAIFGSLTLNNGFDVSEVKKIITKAHGRPFIIWGPTLASAYYLAAKIGEYAVDESWVKGSQFPLIKKSAFRPVTCLDKKGNLTEESIGMLDLLKKNKGIFASGHLSPKETYRLGMAAREFNVSFIATHVLLGDKSPLTKREMENIVEKGCWLEFCYVFIKDEDYDFKYNRKQIVDQIKYFADRVIMSTDCGQPQNSGPAACLSEGVRLLSSYGLTIDEIKKITIRNPRQILSL